MRVNIEHVFNVLQRELNQDNTGRIKFSLAQFEITVKQNNVVGNLIEEWIDSWMSGHDFDHIYNHGQCSPDFWMNPDNLDTEWLEIKSFTGSANFDISNFMSFLNEVVEKPWKLDSKYLCIKYTMDSNTGVVTIDNIWLKSIWEISCPSARRPVKVQEKKGVIYNIRPASWYSSSPGYRIFSNLEHFLSALDYVVKTYPGTAAIGMTWRTRVERAYSNYKGISLQIPLWQDIADQYGWR